MWVKVCLLFIQTGEGDCFVWLMWDNNGLDRIKMTSVSPFFTLIYFFFLFFLHLPFFYLICFVSVIPTHSLLMYQKYHYKDIFYAIFTICVCVFCFSITLRAAQLSKLQHLSTLETVQTQKYYWESLHCHPIKRTGTDMCILSCMTCVSCADIHCFSCQPCSSGRHQLSKEAQAHQSWSFFGLWVYAIWSNNKHINCNVLSYRALYTNTQRRHNTNNRCTSQKGWIWNCIF